MTAPSPVLELAVAHPGSPAAQPIVPALTKGAAVPYDFRRPTKISREHIRTLNRCYETFARQLSTLLTSGLRQVCTVTINDISQRSYDDYISELPNPTVVIPLSIAPLSGTGTIHFSLPVTLAAIDHMLGGPGGRQPARTLTDIENTLFRGTIDQIVGTLRYAMEPVVALDPQAGAIEYNPAFVQAAGPADAVVVGEFDLVIGQERSPLTICLPLGPLLPRLNAQRPREAAADGAGALALTVQVREKVAELPLEVSLQFAPVLLSPQRILSLAVGDVVRLPHRTGSPLTVHAGGQRYAHAVAGKAGGRLAALVVGGSTKEHQ